MKILVDKMPLDPTECLFYSAEEGEGNCVIGTKFESVKEHKGYCRCTVKDRKACPYLQERSQSDMKRDNEVDCYTYEREQKKIIGKKYTNAQRSLMKQYGNSSIRTIVKKRTKQIFRISIDIRFGLKTMLKQSFPIQAMSRIRNLSRQKQISLK